MYDSITAVDIPATAQMVAGYVQDDPSFGWSDADWARFPTAVKVRIATRAWINDGHVLDVETGDATPAQAPGWAQMRRAAGVDPTVYCNASTERAVRAAFDAAGVPQPDYWTAHYDNVPTLPPGSVAKQYINDPISGGHYDLSVVADYWRGVDPVPFTPTPAPAGGFPALDEESVMEMPAGTHVRKRLFAAGRPHFLWWELGWDDVQVTVHQIAYVKRTPPGAGKEYGHVGDPGYPNVTVFDKDRPGPIAFADDVAWVTVEYSCPVDTTAAIG
jgi:hypothetical protein